MSTTILIVDDQPAFRQPIAAILDLRRYRTLCAGDGREALAVLATHTPDLILLDVAMPVMDGVQFLRAIRAAERWRAVPVVVMTAAVDRKLKAELEGLGVSGCLSKGTFSLAEMLSLVSTLVGPGDGPDNPAASTAQR